MGQTSERIEREVNQKIQSLKEKHPMFIRAELEEWRELLWAGVQIASKAITDEVCEDLKTRKKL
jgi:hypothetical protein